MTFIFEDVARPEVIRRERIRTRVIVGVVVLAIVAGVLYFIFKNYPEERVVKHFATALEQGNYQEAYRIWKPTSSYSFNAFTRDWGPNNADYGTVQSYEFGGSRSYGNGVIITCKLNGKEARLWVDRETKAISFAPERVVVTSP